MRVRPQAHFVYRGGARCRAQAEPTGRTLRQRCRSLGEGGGEGGPSAPNHLPPRWAGSTRSRTAPLEVDRSSSQSALSERPGRWNGRVSERRQPLPSERGGGQYDLPSCPACEGMLGRSESPPRRGRRREGRTTVPAGPQLRGRPPLETRGQCTWGQAPAYTVPHASRGLWLERDRKRVPQAGARLPREEQERGTSLVSRHAGARAAVQKLSQPLEWLRSRPSRRVDKRGGGQ